MNPKYILQIPKTIALWCLRVVLLFLPISPFFLLFSYAMSGGASMLVWIVFLFGLDLILSVLRGRHYKYHSVVRWLQLILCWIPPAVLVIFWGVIVGRWIFLMLAWPGLLVLVALIRRLRRQTWRAEWAVHAIGLIFVSAALLFSGMTVLFFLFFLAPVGVLLLLVHVLQRNDYLNCPSWLPLIALSIYGACMFQALFVYVVDERDRREEVVRQPGVQVIDLQDYDRNGTLANLSGNIIRSRLFPITDMSAFLVWGDNLLLLPQHMNTVVRLDRFGRDEALSTDNVTADNVVIDFYRRQFYFVVGSQLFRGVFDGLTFEPVCTFNLERVEHTTPNTIDGFFAAETALVMVQYEYDNAVMIYDVLDNRPYRVEVEGYRMRNSIWHPDGDKIIAVGSKIKQNEGRLFVFNLRGEIVQDVVIQFQDLTFLSHGRNDTILLTQFIGGQVTEWTTQPLAPRTELVTPAGARSTFAPPGSGCLLVSSFLLGSLNVYRLDDHRLLRSLYIGRRARSIQPSLADDSFLISTAVGLLKIDAQSLLAGCPGEAL